MIFTITSILHRGRERQQKMTWGYFPTEAEAVRALAEQGENLTLSLHNYLVVEQIRPGIAAQVQRELWFVFMNGYWASCAKPIWSNENLCWAMGG